MADLSPSTLRDEGGFALALVVLLLFAIGVLGTTGYQIAVAASDLATQKNEAQHAQSIARAGLQQYMATQLGVPTDTVTYSLEGGDAIVTSRLIARTSDVISLYMVKSEGVYLDPVSSSSPARRTLYQFAEHRQVMLDFDAVLVMASGSVLVNSGGLVDGGDFAGAGECEQAQLNIGGVLLGSGTATYSGSDVDGSPDSLSVGSYEAVIDSLGLTWEVFTDPNFPVDFQDQWPGATYADSFKVTRFSGDLSATSAESGSGLLIVQGNFRPGYEFWWKGIIMAESMTPNTAGKGTGKTFWLEGVVVTGLDNLSLNLTLAKEANIEFERCWAYEAASKVAYFRPVKNAWWEGN